MEALFLTPILQVVLNENKRSLWPKFTMFWVGPLKPAALECGEMLILHFCSTYRDLAWQVVQRCVPTAPYTRFSEDTGVI